MGTSYEILENEREIKLRVSGQSLEKLFSNALLGTAVFLNKDIASLKKNQLKEWQEIRVEAVDIPSLLVEFLSKAIEKSDLHGAVFPVLAIDSLGENFLEGKIFGMRVNDFENPIREVSYDEVNIEKNPQTGMFETVLVFEV